MSSREVILARIRSSLSDIPRGVKPEDDVPVEWKYAQEVEVGDVLDRFEERVVDYKATVIRCPLDQIPAKISEAVRTLDIKSVVAPEGIDDSWRDAVGAGGAELIIDTADNRLSHQELNDTGAVFTASAVGSAETGTIVLDHSADQGRRALSLVPDVHLCVIRADQVVSSVPESVARLKPSVLKGLPLTWISGPSATSDIELSRVEGVHGPRTLYVILGE